MEHQTVKRTKTIGIIIAATLLVSCTTAFTAQAASSGKFDINTVLRSLVTAGTITSAQEASIESTVTSAKPDNHGTFEKLFKAENNSRKA